MREEATTWLPDGYSALSWYLPLKLKVLNEQLKRGRINEKNWKGKQTKGGTKQKGKEGKRKKNKGKEENERGGKWDAAPAVVTSAPVAVAGTVICCCCCRFCCCLLATSLALLMLHYHCHIYYSCPRAKQHRHSQNESERERGRERERRQQQQQWEPLKPTEVVSRETRQLQSTGIAIEYNRGHHHTQIHTDTHHHQQLTPYGLQGSGEEKAGCGSNVPGVLLSVLPPLLTEKKRWLYRKYKLPKRMLLHFLRCFTFCCVAYWSTSYHHCCWWLTWGENWLCK